MIINMATATAMDMDMVMVTNTRVTSIMDMVSVCHYVVTSSDDHIIRWSYQRMVTYSDCHSN